MKEVHLKRFAGPFNKAQLPFKKYIQSPVGLVPKGENETRLIFHLSYNFKGEKKSINANTPRENFNYRIFARYVTSKSNNLADSLSRGQMQRFFKLAPLDVKKHPDPIPVELWPISRIWQK